MNGLRKIIMWIAALALFGCGSDADESKQEGAVLARAVGAPVLAVEAAQLKRLAPAGTSMLIQQGSWPQGIAQLRPQEVRVTPQGVFVQRFRVTDREQGVFIAYADTIISTAPDRNPSFTPVDGLVYQYTVKH